MKNQDKKTSGRATQVQNRHREVFAWSGSILLICSIYFLGLANLALASEEQNAKALADSIEAAYVLTGQVVADFDPESGLDAYLSYAALHNPGLRGKFHGWQSALAKAGYAGALPDPTVAFGYYIENVETRVGPQNQRVGFRQSLPWFGTLDAKHDMAFEAAQAAFQQYQAEKLKLYYRVKAAYYEYYYLARNIELTRENLELLTFWESVARTKYEAGLRQHPDVIKAQVELGKLEDQLLSLEDTIDPLAARLRATLNLPDSIYLPLPDSIVVQEIELDKDTVLFLVAENNPDLKTVQHLIEKERSGERLAGKSSWPNFTFGVDYIETGPALNPGLLESGKDPWIINAKINIPLWFGKNAARKREARARHKQAQFDLLETGNRLTALTERALFDYEDALRKTGLYRDGLVPKAEQSLNAAYTAYQAGETDFLNILDAQRQLLNFQLAFERAKTNLAMSAARLEMISGKEIDRSLSK